MNNEKSFEILKDILIQEDPLSLIDLDTPESLNEYDPEINEILKRDISNFSNEEFGQLIYRVFVSFFNEELANGKEKYYVIAERYFDAIYRDSTI